MPTSWMTCDLKTLLTSLESGSRPKGGVRGIKEGIPSIGGEHLTYKGTLDFSSIKYVSNEFASRMNKGHIQKSDILIVKDGATTGKTAFIDEKFPYDNAVVNEHVFVCRPSPLVAAKFVFKYLMSKEGQERILENFQGSAQGGINLSFAPNTEVVLAPVNEQRRIVAKLEKLLQKVDACKERLDKIPTILKRFRQSVLAAACSGRLTEDWSEKNPEKPMVELLDDLENARQKLWLEDNRKRSNNKKRYRKAVKIDIGNKTKGINELFNLPLTWSWVSLGQTVWKTVDGPHYSPKYVSRGVGIPFISSRNVSYNGIDFSDAKYISKKDHNIFVKRAEPLFEDVLLTKGGTTGIATVVSADMPFSIWVHVALLKVVENYVSPYYLRDVLSVPYVYKQSQAQTHGVGNQDLGLTRMIYFALPLPPINEQHEIVCRVEALFKIADQIEERYKKARSYVDKLTQSILAKAFRGELVPQDPTDELASELLKRIKEEKAKTGTKAKTMKRGGRSKAQA